MAGQPQRERATVVFLPSGQRGRVGVGTPVLDAAREVGVELDSICAGRQTCGRCRIRIEPDASTVNGVGSATGRVTAPDDTERDLLDHRGLDGLRLACAARVCGDLVVTVPQESAARKQIVRKALGVHTIEVAPAVRQVWVEVEPAVFGDPRSDAERLRDALTSQWDLDAAGLRFDPAVLRELPVRLRAADWTATVTLRNDGDVTDVRAGYDDRLLGLALDVGSTTIAGHLTDLHTGEVVATAAAVNPQVGLGEDLMSRVAFAAAHPDGLERLRSAAVAGISEVVGLATAEADVDPSHVAEVVLVANTVMLHLLLGIDPAELGAAPFSLAVREPLDVRAPDLGLPLPTAVVHVLASQAGHVGADATAVALACQAHRATVPTLIVDIGTNAELQLAVGGQVYSASTPTGPAFEGAQITHGMRAAPGAIERVRIERATGLPRYRVIGSDGWRPDHNGHRPDPPVAGICGSGIIEAVVQLYRAGIVRPDGRFDPDATGPRLRQQGRVAAYELATAEETASGRPLLVTQADVRAIQLAKAALYAGAKLLMVRAGVDRLGAILLAGAFGSYVDPFHAVALGLVPDCELRAVRSVGNAAGDGARIALLDRARRDEAAALARDIIYVELAVEPGFQDAFVPAMALPHATDAFPALGPPLAPPVRRRPTRRRPTARPEQTHA